MYSSVDQKKLPNKQNEAKFYRAAFDYDAQGDQEISFKAGDHVKLIYHEDDTWWCGEVQGKRGMFPKDFVEEINPWSMAKEVIPIIDSFNSLVSFKWREMSKAAKNYILETKTID